jgi:small-conductance mechanosensitive channel
MVNVLAFIAVVVAVLAIWVQDVTALFVSTGIIGAGVAIALQDVFRNLTGGLIVLFNRTYKIGDRIEVDGKYGDVLDIGLFNTTLLEIQEWVDGDQATGRLTTIPNSFVLSKHFNNYSKEYAFLWDEISIPITYDSDWKKAYEIINSIVEEETKETTLKANQSLKRLGEKYYFTKRSPDTATYISLTDNWINFKIRYTTEVHNRRALNSKLSKRILEKIQETSTVNIASTTLTVSGKMQLEK